MADEDKRRSREQAKLEQRPFLLMLLLDLVVLVEDLFERGSNPAALAPAMRRLSAPLGVWECAEIMILCAPGAAT